MVFQQDLKDESSKQLEINHNCFIRKDHNCGKMIGASKSCFIACPSEDDDVEMTLELISEKLAKVGIEPIIAVKERAYGQDIFCTKICGKIIESKFCLVILDDLIIEDRNIPNPNVYYEYGLMTALKKHIIPFQKEDLKLAFNIQSYDTIKYNKRSISSEIDRAIKDAIKITGSKNTIKSKQILSTKSILRQFELSNLNSLDDHLFLNDTINDTDFMGFYNSKERFCLYLGKLDAEDEIQTYLSDLNIVLHRTNNIYHELKNRYEDYMRKNIRLKNEFEYEFKNILDDDDDDGNFLDEFDNYEYDDVEYKFKLMSNFYIGFIVNSELDASEFIQTVKTIISNYKIFTLVCDSNSKMVFGNIKVDLSPSYVI